MKNKYSTYNKLWKAQNKEREKENYKRWFEENREHRNAYKRAHHHAQKSNPDYRLKRALRSRFSKLFNEGRKTKSVTIYIYIGCSVEELKLYLQSKFASNMNWDNHGALWHIDHIIPLKKFNHLDEEQIYKAWHYTNLQPLYSIDNLRKGDR